MEISVNNMREEYRKAQKKGQREFRARVAKGAYPYLQVLDEIRRLAGIHFPADET